MTTPISAKVPILDPTSGLLPDKYTPALATQSATAAAGSATAAATSESNAAGSAADAAASAASIAPYPPITAASAGDVVTYDGSEIRWTGGLQPGVAGGVAQLDSSGLVPVGQVPDLASVYLSHAGIDATVQPRQVIDPTLAQAVVLTTVQTPTYDGSGVGVHPSVVFVATGWNGYRYWMAMTPYPGSDSQLENPSILASQDGDTWVVPAGLVNPVVAPPTSTSYYNSDPNIVLDDFGTMHLFYRVTGVLGTDQIALTSSTDAVTWTDPVVVFQTSSTVQRLVAPCVTFQVPTRTWVMYAVDIVPSPRTFVRLTATDPAGPWSTPEICTINGNDGEPWHCDVHQIAGEWQALVMDGGAGGGSLWAATSQDGLTWQAGGSLIPGSTPPFQSYYKSAFVPITDGYGPSWDAWIGGANFLSSGSAIERATVSFKPPPARGADAPTVDILAAVAGLPPWVAGDSFARADDTSGLGTAPTGQTWSSTIGAFEILGRAAQVTVDGTNSVATIDSGISDGIFSVWVVAASAATQWYLTFRATDFDNRYRLGRLNDTIVLQSVVGGSVTTLATYGAVNFSVDGAVSVQCQGSSITAYWRNTPLSAPITDDTVSGTEAGIQAVSDQVAFRNFTARTL